FNDINSISFKNKKPQDGLPLIRSATFSLQSVADTYFDMSNWGKGVIWINGHNLGRYWTIGPQQTVYVPAEWLKKGDNIVVIIELIKPEQSVLSSAEKPILDILK